jgi:predicted DNA-binding transcriptional regulator AlpA
MIRLLRFADLEARNIVHSWPQLKRLVEKHGFPKGRMISPNIRAWDEAEIDEWFKSRPSGGTELKGVARTRKGNPGKRKAAASTEATTASTTEATTA